MGLKYIALLSCVLAPVCLAQVSAEEANARLKAKAAARASSQPVSEIDQLRQAVQSLQGQVAALKAENATLRRQMADAKKQVPVSSSAGKQGGPEAGIYDGDARVRVGMKLDDAIKVLGQPEHVDESGDGSKVVWWRAYAQSITAGGFNSVGVTSSRRQMVREVQARVDAGGTIKDFTDSR